VGPLTDKSKIEVEEDLNPPEIMAKTIANMREGGVKCVFGRWLIDGAPKASPD
jgi:hypothetical protein